MSDGPQKPAITVSVTLFADVRRYLPRGTDGPIACTVAEGATVADVLAALGIPADMELTAGIDGELARRDSPLHDGADVMLVSPMEGG
jgi:sulfur carrier protein ThiS